MNKITVQPTCIVVNDYTLGDCPDIENLFRTYDMLTHRFYPLGIYYDKKESKLYLPSGSDLWRIKRYFNQTEVDVVGPSPYKEIDNVLMKFTPRDEDQYEAIKFTCGLDMYADNAYKSQLSVNLNTGKGKTFCSIATIGFFKIKSIIITGSHTLLNQWKSEIIKYTNIPESKIVEINGSTDITKIFSGKSSTFNNASIYLCTHGTLRSYGERFGWSKIGELFEFLGIGLKFFDEAHTNFECTLMIDFYTRVYKTIYLSATPARSDRQEDRIYQISIKNVPKIDLFDENKDPRTSYVAIKWNSHPTARQISACKSKYGLDRMKYIDYITSQPCFYDMMRIIMDLVLKCKGRVLMYIGTNEGILRVYKWICTEYNEFIGDVGIFSSLVDNEMKMEEKKKKLLLSTTKSAGLGEHIEGLKMTILLAEPFKSPVLARQTLGRTRDRNTMYIELVDMGFLYTKKFYNAKLPVFNKYATDVSDTFITTDELLRRSAKLKQDRVKEGTTQPIIFNDRRFDFKEEKNKNIYSDKDNDKNSLFAQKFQIGKNPFL